MKRHESIVILSREHHFGLLFGWKIRQGIQKQVPPERILPYVKYFWENHLLLHFREEETILFASLENELVDQARFEHNQIEQLVAQLMIRKMVQPEQLNMLTVLLDHHIRFEERILFPYLEKELPEDKLLAIGMELQQLDYRRQKDTYPDEFWR
jgi:hemerythrin-like domain-containing protein